jgi:RNA polymerase sigma-70 factor (ECF subfamily)
MNSEVLELLLQNRGAFRRFLERRVGRGAQAEDLLQDAFERGLKQLEPIERETAVGWFYRVLRNAMIDRARRQGASQAALERLARELEDAREEAPDEREAICRCVLRLTDTLKPEYASALRALEIEGQTLAQYASAIGITANNAGVRVHRARAALEKQLKATCGHCAERGCRDCTCRQPREPTSTGTA